MDVLCGVAADFPDAGVGFAPPGRDRVGEPGHGPPGLAVEAVPGAGQQPGGVEDPAVPVELVLIGRIVADPHRPTVGVPWPSGQRALAGGVPPVQTEQYRQAGTLEAGRGEQPGHEPASLILLTDPTEGADAAAGVARPGVAVVPVAGPTELFGQ